MNSSLVDADGFFVSGVDASDMRTAFAAFLRQSEVRFTSEGVTVAGQRLPEWDDVTVQELFLFCVFKEWLHASPEDQSLVVGQEVEEGHPKTGLVVAAAVPVKKVLAQGASLKGPRFASFVSKRVRLGDGEAMFWLMMKPVAAGSFTLVTKEAQSVFAGPYVSSRSIVHNMDAAGVTDRFMA